MNRVPFKTVLYLPSQAAAETEATVTRWHVKPGENFNKGQIFAEVESAKSTFEFEAPCDGKVISILCQEGNSTSFDSPVIEIETSDTSLKKTIPTAGNKAPEFPR